MIKKIINIIFYLMSNYRFLNILFYNYSIIKFYFNISINTFLNVLNRISLLLWDVNTPPLKL